MNAPLDDRLPEGWRDRQLIDSLSGDLSEDRDAQVALKQVAKVGWSVIDVTDPPMATQPSAARRASSILAAVGRPIRVFSGHPLWRALHSDPDRPRSSSGGSGAQDPHMDFVNAAAPPDYVVLYCVRRDEAGGGTNVLAPVHVIDRLSAEQREVLGQRVFRDGVVADLDHVGEDINPFAIWNPASIYRVRWTGKLRGMTANDQLTDALTAFARLITQAEQEVSLKPGQMLVVDQRCVVHGRRALGAGQRSIEPDRRRLLMHAFARREDHLPPSCP